MSGNRLRWARAAERASTLGLWWSPEAMSQPFRNYSSFFQPEELEALTAAYDAAWQHLSAGRFTLSADQAGALKKILAQIILAAACNGKRDVAQLKEIALRGVSGCSRVPLRRN